MPQVLEPTYNQKRILESKNKNIIVSASAGTGKTTVMIEKIAALIEGGVKLNEMLVVTYTRLAAGEMKKRLKEKLAASTNEAVLNQLPEINNCDISTLHGFCANLVRRYFYFAEADPAFAVFDDAEASLEKEKLLEEIFDGLYNEKNDKFLQLAEIFSSGRNDESLKKIVKKIYAFKICMPDFPLWYDALKAKYEVNDGGNYFTGFVNRKWISGFKKYRDQALELSGEAFNLKLEKCALFFEALADKLLMSGTNSFCVNFELVNNVEFDAFRVFAKADKERFPEFYLKASECFYRIKNFITDEKKMLANETPDTAVGKMTASFGVIENIFWLTDLFEQGYAAVKKEKGVLDYNDLEHYTLKILRDDNLRKQIRNSYKLVFVDEFQDTNEVQEQIISLIKNPKSLFLVGDVKQSIYAFRQCRPQIFTSTLDACEKNPDENDVVYMNDNFRSNTGILDFVNLIFDAVMLKDAGGVDYKTTSLLAGKRTGRTPLPPVSVDLIRMSKTEPPKPDKVYSLREPLASGEATQAEAEAAVIARRIGEIVGLPLTDDKGQTRALRFSDIVILMRSGGQCLEICNFLGKMQIPVVSEIKQPLFENTEIKTLINLLKIIDNPLQDVALAACLTGFFGGLTDQQVLEARFKGEQEIIKADKERKEIFFHECVSAYAGNFADETADKIKAFFKLVDRLRGCSQSMTLHQLLSKLLAESDYRLYVAGLPNGDMRCVKTDKFVQSLDGQFFNDSIGRFLEYVSQADDGEESAVSGSPGGDAVRIMTVHSSKGLEFPVVILCDCGKEFNFGKDNSVVCDPETGVGCHCYDIGNKIKTDTLSRKVIYRNSVKKQIEEEMRLLYVALTRAQNHLYVVGCKKENKDGLDFDAAKPLRFLDWVVGVLVQIYGDGILETGKISKLGGNCVFSVFDGSSLKISGSGEKEFKLVKTDAETVRRIREEINFVYPHNFAAGTGLKMSSSKLNTYSDCFGLSDDEPAPATVLFDDAVSETGTAYHKVLENIDLNDRTMKGVEAVIKRLKDSGEIDVRAADKIKPELIVDVFNKSLFNNIQNRKVYRELPFMLKTGADYLLGDKQGAGETVFLQGVIDMLIVDGNSAAVIDFKFSKFSASLKERYQKQLDSYALAVKQILKIDDVKKYLVNVLDGQLTEL